MNKLRASPNAIDVSHPYADIFFAAHEFATSAGLLWDHATAQFATFESLLDVGHAHKFPTAETVSADREPGSFLAKSGSELCR